MTALPLSRSASPALDDRAAQRAARLYLLAAGLTLAAMVTLSRAAAGAGVSAFQLAAWPPLPAAAILALAARAGGQRMGADARHLRYYAIAGLVSVAAPYALAFVAVSHVGAGFMSATYSLSAIFTYCFALMLGMEHARLRRILGLALAFGGAALAVSSRVGLNPGAGAWTMVALAVPVSLAIGNIYRSHAWPPGATPLSLAPGMLAAASLWLMPLVLLAPGTASAAPAGTVALFLGGQTLLLAGNYALFFRLQQLGGPVFLSQIGYVAMIFGAPLGVVLFREPVGPKDLAALALLLAGVAVFSFARAAAKRPGGHSPRG